MAQPAKGLGYVKAAADQLTEAILIFEFFNVLFDSRPFVVAGKDDIWPSFAVADDDAIVVLIGVTQLELAPGFFCAAFNVIVW